MIKKHRKWLAQLLLLSFVLSLSLTGCLKGRLAVDVKSNGSSTVAFSLGMTQKVKTLIASQGEDPLQFLTKDLSESPNNPQDIKISRWTEGEYEWIQGEIAFKDLNEMNERLSGIGYFETFSVTRQPGILRDRFILDARLNPLLDNTSEYDNSDFFNIDPSAFIEFQMMIRLPGDVIESNGVFDGKDSSQMLWFIGSNQAINIHATSETWNWINLGIIGGGAFFVMLAIGGLIILFATSKPKKESSLGKAHWNKSGLPSPPSSSINRTMNVNNPSLELSGSETATPVQNVVQEVQPTYVSDTLVKIGARSLLQDVNHFLLKNGGTISEAPDELKLEWPKAPETGGVQSINIKLKNQNEATINGQVFPATHEGMKVGISACIRELNQPKPVNARQE